MGQTVVLLSSVLPRLDVVSGLPVQGSRPCLIRGPVTTLGSVGPSARFCKVQVQGGESRQRGYVALPLVSLLSFFMSHGQLLAMGNCWSLSFGRCAGLGFGGSLGGPP